MATDIAQATEKLSITESMYNFFLIKTNEIIEITRQIYKLTFGYFFSRIC